MPIPFLMPLLTGAATAAGGYAANQGLNALFGGNDSPQQRQGQQGGRSGLSQFLGGTPGRFEQVGRYNPNQGQAFNQLLQQGLGRLGQAQNTNFAQGYEPFAQQARQQFQQQVVPSLAERFTAKAGGALSSPAFASQLGSAGAQLEGNLATGAAQYGMQNRDQQMNEIFKMLGIGLQPQFDTYQIPGQAGFGETAIGGLGSLMKLLPLLARFGGEYQKSNLKEGESLSPFWNALLASTGGQS